jgi:hypothetical protein
LVWRDWGHISFVGARDYITFWIQLLEVFYLTRTGFTSGQLVSLVKVFRQFKLQQIFFWVFRVLTQLVDVQHLSYLLAGPMCFVTPCFGFLLLCDARSSHSSSHVLLCDARSSHVLGYSRCFWMNDVVFLWSFYYTVGFIACCCEFFFSSSSLTLIKNSLFCALIVSTLSLPQSLLLQWVAFCRQNQCHLICGYAHLICGYGNYGRYQRLW